MVMGRNGHGPIWLWAEMTRNRFSLILHWPTKDLICLHICWGEVTQTRTVLPLFNLCFRKVTVFKAINTEVFRKLFIFMKTLRLRGKRSFHFVFTGSQRFHHTYRYVWFMNTLLSVLFVLLTFQSSLNNDNIWDQGRLVQFTADIIDWVSFSTYVFWVCHFPQVFFWGVSLKMLILWCFFCIKYSNIFVTA